MGNHRSQQQKNKTCYVITHSFSLVLYTLRQQSLLYLSSLWQVRLPWRVRPIEAVRANHHHHQQRLPYVSLARDVATGNTRLIALTFRSTTHPEKHRTVNNHIADSVVPSWIEHRTNSPEYCRVLSRHETDQHVCIADWSIIRLPSPCSVCSFHRTSQSRTSETSLEAWPNKREKARTVFAIEHRDLRKELTQIATTIINHDTCVTFHHRILMEPELYLAMGLYHNNSTHYSDT